jgi:hypothetical protein
LVTVAATGVRSGSGRCALNQRVRGVVLGNRAQSIECRQSGSRRRDFRISSSTSFVATWPSAFFGCVGRPDVLAHNHPVFPFSTERNAAGCSLCMGRLVLERNGRPLGCLCKSDRFRSRLWQQVAALRWRRCRAKRKRTNNRRVHAPNDQCHLVAHGDRSGGLVLASNKERRLGSLFRGSRRCTSDE